MNALVFQIRNLSHFFLFNNVKQSLFDNLSLDIEEGEFVFITGPSGSGKSTMLNFLSAIEKPCEGEIIFKNKAVLTTLSRVEAFQYRFKEIGITFQFPNLIPYFTTIENVMMPALFSNQTVVKIKEKSKQLLMDLEMTSRSNFLPEQLSSGEKQRVGIARALILDPSVILADEPTGNVDRKTSFVILDFLRKINEEQGRTVIVVTHDQNLIFKGATHYELLANNLKKMPFDESEDKNHH